MQVSPEKAELTCKRKVHFEHRSHAREVVKRKNLGRVYKCPVCGLYAIGHKPTRKTRAAMRKKAWREKS